MAAILMVFMVLAQISAAHHHTVHFSDHHSADSSIDLAHAHCNHAQGESEENENNANEQCQICLIAKTIAFGVLSDLPDLSFDLAAITDFSNNQDQVLSTKRLNPINPRAPPSFLI